MSVSCEIALSCVTIVFTFYVSRWIISDFRIDDGQQHKSI
jgi:hypothetical protein